MTWERLTTVIGDKHAIDVRHLDSRMFAFHHPCLSTTWNPDGEFSSTDPERVLKFAQQIAQTGGLG